MDMNLYRKLQEDKNSGLLSPEQYEAAVVELHWSVRGKKTDRRKSLQSKDEVQRRADLRLRTKWFFDVEIHRTVSPLFKGVGDRETIALDLFLPIADKVISYSKHRSSIANTKNKNDLVNTIHHLVKNRRKNCRDRRKKDSDGNYKKTPLKPIYFYKTELLVHDSAGASVILLPPTPLSPLSADERITTTTAKVAARTIAVTTSTVIKAPTFEKKSIVTLPATLEKTRHQAPAHTQPSLDQDIAVVQPIRIAEATATALPMVTVTTTSNDINNDDDDDVSALQRQLERVQRMLKKAKRKKQENNKQKRQDQQVVISKNNTPTKSNVVTKPTWTVNNDVTTMTCRNADCGVDFVIAESEDQNGTPVLCPACWDGEKEALLEITSPTGAKKPKKRKTSTTITPAKKTKRVKPKTTPPKPKTPRPQTPDAGQQLQRTKTPPIPQKNKFQV